MARKQKLELTWIGKEKRSKLEPRVLVEEQPIRSAGRSAEGPPRLDDNLLIKGDNLLALKALESDYIGKVKCVYIDPPYNTKSAFNFFNDGVEHSIWMSLFVDRIKIIRRLLSEDGSIWISLDDNESHYAKVLCDEIFGRRNFVSNVIWQKLYTVKNSSRYLSDMHEHILVYAKNKSAWKPNLVPRSENAQRSYTNPDNDPRGRWTTNAIQARNYYSEGSYEISSPAGRVFVPPSGTYWRVSEETFNRLDADDRIWWGSSGSSTPRVKKFLFEAKDGVVPSTLWKHEEVGTNAEAKAESRALFADKGGVFDTPKPERLIQRVLQLASNPDDLVLDSFAGSGTTGAVAHKMGRQWIMIELGEHADTHIIPRLNKVIDGDDSGGVTGETGWQGGGGYRYFHLAPSLLEKDQWGQYVISKEFKPEMLAEAVCKLMGFTYAPSQVHFWQHGHSTETDFIYVTTQRLTHDALRKLSDEVGDDRTLLICCRAHEPNRFDNLTVRKIPQAVLDKAEWGRDDYSLNIQDAPAEPITEADLDDTAATTE